MNAYPGASHHRRGVTFTPRAIARWLLLALVFAAGFTAGSLWLGFVLTHKGG